MERGRGILRTGIASAAFQICGKYPSLIIMINSIVSNRRMIVIVNDRYFAAYDVVHLFLYLTS